MVALAAMMTPLLPAAAAVIACVDSGCCCGAMASQAPCKSPAAAMSAPMECCNLASPAVEPPSSEVVTLQKPVRALGPDLGISPEGAPAIGATPTIPVDLATHRHRIGLFTLHSSYLN